MRARVSFSIGIVAFLAALTSACTKDKTPAAQTDGTVQVETIDISLCQNVESGSSGPPLQARIIGGIPLSMQPNEIGTAAVAVISQPQGTTTTENICTGTLLNPWVVLTAAHCFHDETDSVVVGFDRSPVCSSVNGNRAVFRQVEKIVRNPLYQNENFDTAHADVALVVLTSPAPFGAMTTILDFDSRAPSLQDDDFLYGLGFGRIVGSTTPTHLPPELHGGKMRFSTNLSQREQASIAEMNPPNEDDFWAINNATSTGICHGDSGGPLLVWRHGRLTQIGIANSVLNAPDESRPNLDECLSVGVYLKTSSVQSWIRTQFRNLTGTELPRN